MSQLADVHDAQFEDLLEVLHRTRGFDFTGYKRASLMRRVRRRMADVGIETFHEYSDHLELHAEEFTALFDTLLINVTGFFRDAAAWTTLRKRVVPAIVDGTDGWGNIRGWSAGCASGEEVYTLAMLLAEELGEADFMQRVKLYATDVDDGALTVARAAVYSDRALEAVPVDLREKYFERAGDRWAFRRDLRRSVICGRNDLTMDAPISRVDLLVCRNTLMYLTADTQANILRRFHFALNPTGVLFLGKAEMVLAHADLFSPVDLSNRLYHRVPASPARVLTSRAWPGPRKVAGRSRSVEVAAFDAAPVAQIVVDAGGALVLSNPRAEALLGVRSRDVGHPFHDLELSYRPLELRSLITQVVDSRRPARVADVAWQRAPGVDPVYLEITVTPLTMRGDRAGVVISFVDTSEAKRMRGELERANADLERAYEELHSINEELETTNEELQSTVEEFETTNEELQSTNEQLETMNTELVSTNDELHAVNGELRERRLELDQTGQFLQNLLASLGRAVIVLDRKRQVYAWSRNARDLWGLGPDEVEGCDFLTLDLGLPVAELTAPLARVLDAEPPTMVQLSVDAIDRRGRGQRLRVRITQLLHDGEVTGAVLVMNESATDTLDAS
ncbi:MAG: PAS domain-containing protein [Geodermatophilaceae bacterium]|nr:PAS domain-containing protein [Geodermatophilaceae bacterium]